MDKHIFILEDRLKSITRDQFRDWVLNAVVPAVLRLGPDTCKVTLSAADQPYLTILPLRRNGLAMFSVTGADPSAILKELMIHLNAERSVYGYRVHESPYLLTDTARTCGKESPGLVLLTMFRKKRDLAREEFMRIWFGEHSPLSITIHPLKNYIRNVVTDTLTDDTPPFDGIVEEHFGSDRDLLNPVRMFGGITRFLPSMIRIGRHVSTFIDYSSIGNFICREYCFRGGPAACNEEMRDDIIIRDRGSILAKGND